MANGITGIDHGLIGVRDLEAARGLYERLGFTITPRGVHGGWGTANYCIMFDDDYLELLGAISPNMTNPRLQAALSVREGMFAVALGSDDGRATYDGLKAAGLNPAEPADLSRQLELPGEPNPVTARFRLVDIPAESTPNLTMFVCQHLDPALVWRPEWQVHANGARGVIAITVVVDRPEPLLTPYEKIFGPGSCSPTDDTLAAFTGKGKIMFVTPDDLKLLYPNVDFDENLPTPYVAGVSLDVMTPETAASYFMQTGVPYSVGDDGTVRVAPDQTAGVILEFARAPLGM